MTSKSSSGRSAWTCPLERERPAVPEARAGEPAEALRLARGSGSRLAAAVARDVAVRPRLILVGLVVAAVIDAAVLGTAFVSGAPEVVLVEGLALEQRLPPLFLLDPADHFHVDA